MFWNFFPTKINTFILSTLLLPSTAILKKRVIENVNKVYNSSVYETGNEKKKKKTIRKSFFFFFFFMLTIVMLNKLRGHSNFYFSANQIT